MLVYADPVARFLSAGVAVPNSRGDLLSQLYFELRHLSAQKLALENPSQTLQATEPVHEAWMRLGRAGKHLRIAFKSGAAVRGHALWTSSKNG